MSLIDVSGLTFSYDTNFEDVFENVSFQIDTNWKLGFVGRNGRGKTTFLNLLMGKYEYRGRITASVDFDYFPFEVEDMSKNTMDIIDSVNSNYEYWELSREFSYLDITDDVLYRPFGTLSSGERTKVLLAALFLKKNNFLLLDEPTNHLDVDAKDELKRAFIEYKGSILMVCHEPEFYDGLADDVWDCSEWTTKLF